MVGLIIITVFGWMAYEIWRAPLMEETEDGKLITKRPAKTFRDIFKRKKS